MLMMKFDPKKLGNIVEGEFYKRLHGRRRYVLKAQGQLEINLVTSWNKQCGIATYSTFLAEELRKKVKLFITSLPDKNALNPYFLISGYRAGRSNDLINVQFEYGLFPSLKFGKKSLTAFAALQFYLGLALGNRKVITTFHEPRKTVVSGGRGAFFYTKLLDRLIFAVSNLIIVHTHESKSLMKTVYGVAESRLLVIPHGSFENPVFLDKENCKRKFGLQGKTVMTILGFVTPKKGHDLVIPLLPQIDPNVQLVIAGGPQNTEDKIYLKRLKKLSEQYQCSDRVTFTGFLPDLTCIINSSDIAILPYRTVIDSGILHLIVAYKVPTIASDLKAFKEVYDEFGCLELFVNEDSHDLLREIQTLLSDQKQRDLLIAKCTQMWNETRWRRIAEKYLDAYRAVLSTNLG